MRNVNFIMYIKCHLYLEEKKFGIFGDNLAFISHCRMASIEPGQCGLKCKNLVSAAE